MSDLTANRIYAVAFVLWVSGLLLGMGIEANAGVAKMAGSVLSIICFFAIDYLTLIAGDKRK